MLIPAMNSYGTSKILVHQDELALLIAFGLYWE